ncbi:MAG: dTDP-4-dehydrorhamnose 3,5-epimerase [Candidatus Delongbacteria bacterium]|nr:dTDP-4-dehydrorhamnose 3,5-epimerase [Candidatus Delongbacteria bacterium]
MEVSKFDIKGPMLLTPRSFKDERGLFLESFNLRKLSEIGINNIFVQDNVSESRLGVLRGLHYQIIPLAQAKMIIVLSGKILDIAVDIRKGSPTYGKHISVELSSTERNMLFIPNGFAHGFIALQDNTIVQYKCDEYYSPEHERGINYSDPALNIDWKYPEDKMIVAKRDLEFPNLDKADMNFIYEG